LVVSRDGEEAHGSGRSIKAFHLLNALESCPQLFTRYGGHAHAVGFSMPAERVPELRAYIDQYARQRLTLADFEPVLDIDAELPLDQVTPELFQALKLLEPFGVGNPEPVFAAHDARLTAPPRILKDKHVKLKLAWNGESSNELTAEAVQSIPRCHPDSAAIRRRTENQERKTDKWRKSVTYDALGWHMAERVQQAQLLPGDVIDIAFSVDQNEHPEFGGLELSLRDFKVRLKTTEDTEDTEGKSARAIGH
jgi:single-stranded-DNA-specific exonuclease